MRRAAVLLVLPLLLVAACGDDSGTTSTGGQSTPTAPGAGLADGMAIRISVGGGYSPQGIDFAAIPTVVQHDGTVFTGGAMTMQYPGPALSPVSTGHLSEGAVARLVEQAKAAHLDRSRDFGMPGVTDMASTTIEVEIGGRAYVSSVYALGFDDQGDSSMTDEQRTARREASAFVQEVGQAVADAATDPFAPTAYQVQAFAAGDPATGEGEPQPNDLDWPLAQPLVADRCVDVADADAEALTRALEPATSITRWHSGGQVFTLAVKTVLPGTEPCPTA
jgi:hypothetical protein